MAEYGENAQSNLAEAKKKAEAINKQTEDALKATQEELKKVLAEVMASIQGDIAETFEYANFCDEWWRMDLDSSIIQGDGVMQDVLMLMQLGEKLAGAVTNGLLHILKKAATKMLKEQNPIRLITMTIPNFTTLCGAAAGFQIICIMMIINTLTKIAQDFTLKKAKCKLLTLPLIKGQTMSQIVLKESETRMMTTSQIVPEIVDTYLENINSVKDKIKSGVGEVPSGTITPEDEEKYRKQIEESNIELNELKIQAESQMSVIQSKLPGLVDDFHGLLTGIIADVDFQSDIHTPDTIDKYLKAYDGLTESHDKYAKLIASLFTKAKAGGNPVMEILNGLDDPDLKELAGVLNVTQEQVQETMGSEAAAAVQQANDAAASAQSSGGGGSSGGSGGGSDGGGGSGGGGGTAASSAATSSAPTDPAVPETLQEKIKKAQEEVSKNSLSLAQKTAEKAAVMASNLADYTQRFAEILNKAAQSLIDYITAEVETLSIEKIYDVFKMVNGEPFCEAICSMMSLEQFFKVILAKIYLGYKGLGDLLDAYFNLTVEIYKGIFAKSDCLFIIKKFLKDIQAEIDIPGFTLDMDGIAAIAEAVKSIAASAINIASVCMKFISELPAKVAELLAQLTAQVAAAIMKLLGQLAQLLVDILIPINTPSLPSADPLSPIIKLIS